IVTHGNIGGVPPQYRMAAMPERSRHRQSLQFRRGSGHGQKALTELDQVQSLILQMLDDLAGKSAVVGELTQVIAAGKVEDFFLDEGEVSGVARRGGQKSLVAPDIIRHAVTPYPADD